MLVWIVGSYGGNLCLLNHAISVVLALVAKVNSVNTALERLRVAWLSCLVLSWLFPFISCPLTGIILCFGIVLFRANKMVMMMTMTMMTTFGSDMMVKLDNKTFGQAGMQRNAMPVNCDRHELCFNCRRRDLFADRLPSFSVRCWRLLDA